MKRPTTCAAPDRCAAHRVGNVHLLTAFKSEIDIPAIEAIRNAVPRTPSSCHGGTGFPDDAVRAAISAAVVAKFTSARG